MDKVGVASNLSFDSNGSMAVAYSLGRTHVDDFYLNNPKDFTGVQYVNQLPQRKQLRGEITTVDEVASETDYYDGSLSFKTTTVVCNQWTTQREVCLKQKACGWCASTGSCIPGNNFGPLAPCIRGRYVYSSPQENFNPFETHNINVKRQNIGGVQLTTMTPQ
jgi:hypothetical protein